MDIGRDAEIIIESVAEGNWTSLRVLFLKMLPAGGCISLIGGDSNIAVGEARRAAAVPTFWGSFRTGGLTCISVASLVAWVNRGCDKSVLRNCQGNIRLAYLETFSEVVSHPIGTCELLKDFITSLSGEEVFLGGRIFLVTDYKHGGANDGHK